MPHSRDGYLGIALQSAWGVVGTDFQFLPTATETLGNSESVSMVRDEFSFGSRAPIDSVVGNKTFGGAINIDNLRYKTFPYFLKAALGRYTVSQVGTSTDYSHKFSPAVSRHSPSAALPPITVIANRAGIQVAQYTDCQVSSFRLTTGAEAHNVGFSTDLIARDRGLPATLPTPTYTESIPLLWRQMGISLNGSPWSTVRSFELSVDNGISPDRTANQASTISHVDFESSPTMTLSVDLRYENADFQNQALTGARNNIEITWTEPSEPTFIRIKLPKAQVRTGEAAIGGGDIPLRVTFDLLLDSVAGYALEFEVVNKTEIY